MDHRAAELRLQCLKMAQDAAVLLRNSLMSYSIVGDAENYWKFVRGEAEEKAPLSSSSADGDNIPF